MRRAAQAGPVRGQPNGQQVGAAARCPLLWGPQLAEALHPPALKHLLALHQLNQCAPLLDFEIHELHMLCCLGSLTIVITQYL